MEIWLVPRNRGVEQELRNAACAANGVHFSALLALHSAFFPLLPCLLLPALNLCVFPCASRCILTSEIYTSEKRVWGPTKMGAFALLIAYFKCEACSRYD